MSIAKKLLIPLFATGAFIVAAAPHYNRTRPTARCYLPEYDYQFQKYSQPKQAMSRIALSLSSPAELDPAAGRPSVPDTSGVSERRTVKAFQFIDKSRLQIDHCSVSRMSVLLHKSGHWSVSLRADQNPLIPPPPPLDVGTNDPARLFTDHLQRNEFHIKVRCYATQGATTVDGLLGQPQLLRLCLDPFWVQKQQPRQIYMTGHDPRIADYFGLIDRVELEFSYRID